MTNKIIEKPSLKNKLRLFKWAWITLAIWLIAQPIFIIVFRLWLKLDFAYWLVFILGILIAGFFIIKVCSSYKYRKIQYINFHNSWVKDPSRVSKTVLYLLSSTLCGKTTSDILSEEFGISIKNGDK